MQFLGEQPRTWPAILAVLVGFVLLGSWYFQATDGQDLGSSYVGSRLLIEGLDNHLFQYDSGNFAEIGDDDTWTEVADRGGFEGFLHPYVQTPLWAYLLQPICRRLDFLHFNLLFVVLNMLCFAGTIWLTAKYWATSLFNPLALVATLVLLWFSVPFQYAMFLNQTHILFVFLTVAALLLAEHDWPILAGFCLAYASSVKVTPILLVLYWLVGRRWKAAASAVVWSGVLWVLTLFAVGHTLTTAYLASMQRVSQTLLLSLNNQSFAAWVMQHFHGSDEVYDITIFHLPTAMRLGGTALMLLGTLWGGWLDWRRSLRGGERTAPLGAMMAVIAATTFAPIAWVHYLIVLVIPLMLLADANRTLRLPWMWAVIAVAILLNCHPLSGNMVVEDPGRFTIIRGPFFSSVLVYCGLAAMAMLQNRRRNREQIHALEDAALAA